MKKVLSVAICVITVISMSVNICAADRYYLIAAIVQETVSYRLRDVYAKTEPIIIF